MAGSRTTVVVGGGCSGALTAIQLLRRTDDRVVVVEQGERVGPGVAYGTTEAVHLLNSRAGAMSAYADEPDHFVAWNRDRDRLAGPATFAPRRVYGDYLRETLDAVATANPGRLHHLRGHAERVSADPRPAVLLRGGTVVFGERVVLAVGNARPADPPFVADDVRQHPAYVADPWAPDRLAGVPRGAPVLLLGSGLTAVDVALSLVARGHHGPIVALSRHGLLPAAHTVDPAPPQPVAYRPAGSLRALLADVRGRAVVAGDWRAVIDGLRPHTNAHWRCLSDADRRRFVAHVGRLWEVHRHRMAPVVATAVDRLRAGGALTVLAGRLTTVSIDGPALRVRVSTSDGRCPEWMTGAVVNCTGSACPTTIPLIGALVADGIAGRGRYGIGLDVDDHGRPLAPDGRPATGIYTVGPARRGRWFETTAVPEIRAQAHALVQRSVSRRPAVAA